MISKEDFKVILIRHAESDFNAKTEQFVAENQMVYDWYHLSKHQGYLTKLKYNYDILDCNITQTGKNQCAKAKEQAQNFKPDLILVSPLNRTLQTCSQIFGDSPACRVIVQPILAQSLRSSCDYSCEIELKKKKYPHYDFSKVQVLGKFWYILNDSAENQSKYNEVIKQHENQSYDAQVKACLAYMLETWIYETGTNLRARAGGVKKLLKEYSQKYQKIAVVSHYNIIRFTLATEFNEHDEPFHCHIENCQINRIGWKQIQK